MEQRLPNSQYITYRQALAGAASCFAIMVGMASLWVTGHTHQEAAQKDALIPIRVAIITNTEDIKKLVSDVETGLQDMTVMVLQEGKIARAILQLLEDQQQTRREKKSAAP